MEENNNLKAKMVETLARGYLIFFSIQNGLLYLLKLSLKLPSTWRHWAIKEWELHDNASKGIEKPNGQEFSMFITSLPPSINPLLAPNNAGAKKNEETPKGSLN